MCYFELFWGLKKPSVGNFICLGKGCLPRHLHKRKALRVNTSIFPFQKMQQQSRIGHALRSAGFATSLAVEFEQKLVRASNSKYYLR